MNSENIELFFIHKAMLNKDYVQIKFKKREPILGLFLKEADYPHLKSKNFWRVVPQSQLQAYKASKDASLARIFNGDEFSKLVTYEETFE